MGDDVKDSGTPEKPPLEAIQQKAEKPLTFRDRILQATPAIIINSSSNVIGAMHIVAEFMMLKAAGIKFWKNNRGGTEVNAVIDPANNLWRGLTGADKDKLMQNQWQTRSTMSGFSAWVIGSILPDRKDEESAKQADAKLWEEAPAHYAGKRVFEGIQIGNPDTKRQQIGLGVTLAGLFSARAGFNNIDLKTATRFTNWPRTIGGLITALSGANLLFAKNDRDGWKGFGSVLWLRLPFAGLGTYKMYTKNDRWLPYLGGQIMFQSAAVYAYLFGGLEKLPDGTIVESTKGGHGAPAEPEKAPLKPLFEQPEQPEQKPVEPNVVSLLPENAPDTKVASVEVDARVAGRPQPLAQQA